MTDFTDERENIRDVWAQYKADRAAQFADAPPIGEQWKIARSQEPIPPLQDISFTAQELTEFFDFRHRPGLASWGEFCAEKGYSFAEALQPLIDKKNNEFRRSVVKYDVP